LIEFVMEADITLTVVYESTAPVITRQPEDQVVNYGGTAVFEVNAIGSTDMNYEWRFNGWIFQSGPSNTAVLENVGSDYDGLYEVTVSNNFGSTTSRAARLTTVGNWFDNQGFEYGLESWNAAGNVRTQASASTDPGNRMVAAFNTGNTTPNGSLCQVVGVDPGKTYLVTFDLGVTAYNTAEQRMLVRIDGAGPLFEGEFTIKGRGNGLTTWQRTSLVFTADAYSAVISFTDGSAVTHAIDMLLDNVDISEVADGAVPMSAEPSEIE
jgi:hypothetical protein